MLPMAGANIEVRLATPLTSYDSEAGTPFRAVVIAPFMRDGKVLMPPGTVVLGHVTHVARVGMGMLRERASMDLEFERYELPDGREYPMQATVRRIDNARESVSDRGTIKGILAANGPQSLLGGVWRSPNPELLQRSFIGLTGAGGKIFTEYSMGPIGAVGIFAVRIAMFRLPEPEIRMPAGVEMFIEPSDIPEDAPVFELPEPAVVPVGLRMWLANQQTALSKPGGGKVKDIINVAFVGSRDEVEQSFIRAGWTVAEPWNGHSFTRSYDAYNAQAGYQSAPVSKIIYREREPDLVFEKMFNTLSKRHHIRLWQVSMMGQKVWLGAASHDVGVSFRSSHMSFDHKIHPRIDLERSKTLNDLSFAGCLEPVGYVERPTLIQDRTMNGITTDGRLAVAFLKSGCSETFETPELKNPRPPLTKVARLARRMMLEGRQYVFRGNPYYLGYRAFAFNRERRRENAALNE